jgi:hypothetical protein
VAEGAAPEQMTPEQLAEQIRQIKVSDVLLSSLSTIAQLGYAKLEASSRDLGEAKLAIEALRALIPILEGSVDEAIVRDFRQVVANLQLAYADATTGADGDS